MWEAPPSALPLAAAAKVQICTLVRTGDLRSPPRVRGARVLFWMVTGGGVRPGTRYR
jgi:hypothetical protein